MKLKRDFYQRDDVVKISRELLGKVLVTKIDNKLTSGVITETEAYDGRRDRACHAYGGKRTKRNEVMYHLGGCAYVYLCYGLHHLFNIVTNDSNKADAILIRAVEPLEGVEVMLKRRKQKKLSRQLTSGPGKLAQALGITTELSGESLFQNKIWIEDREIKVPKKSIETDVRIGIDYAGEDARLPWRFYLKDSDYVSVYKKG